MEILHTYSLVNFIDLACGLPVVTIFTCYFIALALGHVNAWLPMISDCGVSAPEKYLFRLGLITSAGFIARCSKSVRDVISHHGITTGASLHRQNWIIKPEDVSVVLASIASFGLAGLSAVSEKEDDAIHTGCAVLFFAVFIAYMYLTSFLISEQGHGENGPWNSFLFNARLTIAIVTTVDFVIFIYLGAIGRPLDPDMAIEEWVGVGLILLYNWLFRFDFELQNGKTTTFSATVYNPKGGEWTPLTHARSRRAVGNPFSDEPQEEGVHMQPLLAPARSYHAPSPYVHGGARAGDVAWNGSM